MNDDNKFVNGLFFKEKHSNAPDFVIGKLSTKRQDLIDYLQQSNEDWLNWQIKKSKAGKCYIEVDTWKPDAQSQTPSPNTYTGNPSPNDQQHPTQQEIDDDLPF